MRETFRHVAVLVAALSFAPVVHAEPCEDETGRLFRDGPNAFVDGLRPQGYCGPPGWREELALRRSIERARMRREGMPARCLDLPTPAYASGCRRIDHPELGCAWVCDHPPR